jgi:protein-tyrosine phosphatase
MLKINAALLITGLLMSACSELKNNDMGEETTDKSSTFEVFTFDFEGNKLSMSPLPGKQDLLTDMQTIQKHDVTAVVTLVTQEELEKLELTHLFETYKRYGILSLHVPIPDFDVPQDADMTRIRDFVRARFDNGEHVLIHCMGGLGRSGTALACLAKDFLKEEAPIDFVRAVRGSEAIETKAQEEFVEGYGKE